MKRNKRKYISIGANEFYYYYRHSTTGGLTSTQFRLILKLFFTKLVSKIYSGFKISLPLQLGDFFVMQYLQKLKLDDNGEIISKRHLNDYKATKELWKEKPELAHKKYIYYTNDHTDNKRFKLNRNNYKGKVKLRSYNFKPARAFSRGLAQHIFKNPNTEYYE